MAKKEKWLVLVVPADGDLFGAEVIQECGALKEAEKTAEEVADDENAACVAQVKTVFKVSVSKKEYVSREEF